MPRIWIAVLVLVSLTFFSPRIALAAAWDTCKGCHNGNVAPDEKKLKEKYPTIKKFVDAAKKSDDPFMNEFKDEKILTEAARDIGLK